MIDIALQEVRKVYFTQPVLESVTLELQEGERIGLLGNNGSGKTTLFKIITGEEPIESGQLFIRKGVTIGMLRQQPPKYEDKTVREVMEEAFVYLLEMAGKIQAMTTIMEQDPTKGEEESFIQDFGELTLAYESMGGYEKDDRLMKISRGMNIVHFLNRKYESLSGGEKIRVELGKLLLSEPDVMLLDEPTNHLDLAMTSWLEEFLKTYKGSVLIISHDRYFLDRVVTKIYAIEDKQMAVYYGNYSDYVIERQARYEQSLVAFQQQEKKVKQLEEASKRMRQWAAKADNEAMYKRAKAMEKRIERMERRKQPKLDEGHGQLMFETGDRAGKHVLSLDHYTLYIQDRILVKQAQMLIDYGEHVAIIGNNGTGKSTLIRRLIEACEYTEGVYYPYPIESIDEPIRLNPRARIGYLEQDIQFEDEAVTVLDYMRQIIMKPEHDVRRYLGRFGFYTEDIHKTLSVLSGGEKVRLILARLMHYEVNVLVMDEPTNHIDIKTKELLETALTDFDGTIIAISHDRYFLDQLFDTIYCIENQRMQRYEGNYSDYVEERERIESRRKEAVVVKKETIKKKEPLQTLEKNERRLNPQKVEKMEGAIEALEEELAMIRTSIREGASDYELIEELMKKEEEMNSRLEEAMEKYLEYIE